MNYTCNMPVDAEESYDKSREQGSSNNFKSSLYKPLPHVAGESFVNELILPVFSPKNWEIFNQPPEVRERLGMTDVNPFAAGEGQEDLITFYLRVAVHSVKNYTYPDGHTGFASIVCPKQFNEYLSKVATRPKLFKSDNCPFCNAASNAWGQYNARWKDIEQERGILKKDLTQEGRREIAKQDDILKYYYEQARSLTPADRYVLSVFDHSKFVGNRPLDGADEQVEYQTYFAPKTIFTNLVDYWKESAKSNESPFFSIEDPEGFRIVKVKKSTEECRGNNLRDTKYTIMMGQKFKYSDEWTAYLSNIDNMADPSPYLTILSPSEMSAYADTPDEADSYNAPPPQRGMYSAQNVPSNAPATRPHTAPPVRQQPVQAPRTAPRVDTNAPVMQSYTGSHHAPPPSVADTTMPVAPSQTAARVEPQDPPVATYSAPPVPTVPPARQSSSSPVPPVPGVPGISNVSMGMPAPPMSAPVVPDRTPPEGSLPPNRHKW